jgi:hypothetical protein
MIKGTPKKLIDWLYDQDKEKVFEVKEYREKRNLDQNAKYWKLLNELALKLKISVEELHFQMLKFYSQRYQILIPTETSIRGIEYYEKKSTIKKDNKLFDVYIIYTPSHELNTEEFSLLLEGLCNECKEQGIETRSPEELSMDKQLRG